MSKQKKVFYCQKCGHEDHSWVGKCPACGSWNTYVEETQPAGGRMTASIGALGKSRPVGIKKVGSEQAARMSSGMAGIDTLLGGGIVRGSVVLVGGEPGIGKSTLLIQMALHLQDKTVLYVSGEESPQQVSMRAKRVGRLSDKCYVVGESCLEHIMAHANSLRPAVLIVDSVQTLYSTKLASSAGSILQVRSCTSALMQHSKEFGLTVFVVGHINKEGMLAGPKALEHIVDVVLQFEGDRRHTHRMLRVIKNRFGPTGALSIYEMGAQGLQEVQRPSQLFIQQRTHIQSGVAIASAVDGNRPFLVEVQGLVSKPTYAGVQRICTGFDHKRLNMLLAMLDKKMGLLLSGQDVFINITGGLRIEDPAVDLAVCVCVVSSLRDQSIPGDTIFSAEVGLGGELRPVSHIKKRAEEAAKLGFKRLYVPQANVTEPLTSKMEVLPFHTLPTLMQDLLPASSP